VPRLLQTGVGGCEGWEKGRRYMGMGESEECGDREDSDI